MESNLRLEWISHLVQELNRAGLYYESFYLDRKFNGVLATIWRDPILMMYMGGEL